MPIAAPSSDGFAKQFLVARDDLHALSAARRRHVKQLVPHPADVREDDGVDSFALAAMCRSGASIGELQEVPRSFATVFETDAASLIHTRDRNDFAVCGAKTGIAPIGGE
jgi:hypothetical protein